MSKFTIYNIDKVIYDGCSVCFISINELGEYEVILTIDWYQYRPNGYNKLLSERRENLIDKILK